MYLTVDSMANPDPNWAVADYRRVIKYLPILNVCDSTGHRIGRVQSVDTDTNRITFFVGVPGTKYALGNELGNESKLLCEATIDGMLLYATPTAKEVIRLDTMLRPVEEPDDEYTRELHNNLLGSGS